MSKVGSSTCIADKVFPLDVIAALNAYADALGADAQAAGITRTGTKVRMAEGVRRSDALWLPQDVVAPFYKTLSAILQKANADVFRFELTGLREAIQLATYRAENRGAYGWHIDTGVGPNATRKISAVIPLTDPSHYEGGQFEAFYNDEPTIIPMPLGRVVMFPSYVLHRVTPVTKGIRRTLAVWVSGPPFR